MTSQLKTALIHWYELNGSLIDSRGSKPLTGKQTVPFVYLPQNEAALSATALNKTYTDASGDSTYNNVTLGATGIGDGETAASYNGATSYTQLPASNLDALWDNTEYSLSVWMKTSTIGSVGVQTALSWGASGTNRVFAGKANAANILQAFILAGGGSNSGAYAYSSTDWVHMGITLDSSRFKFFADGAKRTDQANALGAWVGALTNTWSTLGKQNVTGFLNGDNAHFVAINRALTETEMNSLAVVVPDYLGKVLTIANAATITYGSGLRGQNQANNSSGEAVNLYQSDVLSGQSTWTIQRWITFAEAVSTDRWLLAIGGNDVILRATPTGYTVTGGGVTVSLSVPPTIGSPQYVAITYDGTALGLFVNGAFASSPVTVTQSGELQVFLTDDEGSQAAQFVGIWSEALDLDDLNTLYLGQYNYAAFGFGAVVDTTKRSYGTYQLAIIDPQTQTLLTLATPQDFRSMKYERKLNDVGRFSLSFHADSKLAQYDQRLDLVVDVWRDPDGDGLRYEATYLMRYWNRSGFGGEDTYVWGGLSLEHLLARRLIDPTDDPLGAGGFSTKGASIDLVMSQYVEEQAISPATNANRSIPYLMTSGLTLFGTQSYQRLKQEDNLLKTLQKIVNKELNLIDFWIERDTTAMGLSFVFYAMKRGRDMTYTTNFPNGEIFMFDPKRGNMIDPELTVDRRKEVTRVYLGGEGIEGDRIYLVRQSSGTVDSPFNVIEGTTDVRIEDTLDEIEDTASTYLNDKRPQESLTFEPRLDLYTIPDDIDVGDQVTGRWGTIAADYRVLSITIKIDGNGEDVDMKLDQYSATYTIEDA